MGLPDNAIKESNYRIAAALQNTGYKLPGKKITINMAPADVRKEGSAYDLPIAFIVEQAGGAARSMNQRILEIEPTSLHQRSPFFCGNKEMINLLISYL